MNLKIFGTSCLVAAVLVTSVGIFGYSFPAIVIVVYGLTVWRKK